MPYIMSMHTDGACRYSPETGPIAAVAVIMTNKFNNRTILTEQLPPSPTPTTQRAHLTSIIHALSLARTKAEKLRPSTYMDITIHSSSKYVIGCMTQFCWKWMRNGFLNYKGQEIANRDLVERALVLEGQVLEKGTVVWVWVPARVNEVAGKVVRGVLNEMERDEGDRDSDEPFREVWERVDL